MSVLIKGMEKPEHCGYCRFRYDGICHALQKTQYSMNECPLVVIDDAGLNDTISRQAAIDALARMMPRSYTPDGSHPADEEIFRAQEVFADCIEALEILPSAQPEQPPYVAEIEAEYQKAVKMPHIHKPLAKALYEVWKKHDREDAERRTDG